MSQLFALFHFAASLAIASVPAALGAVAVACALNLPTSLPLKLLALVGIVWGVWINHHLAKLRDALGEATYWSRYACVALGIRNEHDKLPSARQRIEHELKLDKEEQEIDRQFVGVSSNSIMTVGGFVLFAIFLGIALDRGWFGPVAYNWTTDLAAWANRHGG